MDICDDVMHAKEEVRLASTRWSSELQYEGDEYERGVLECALMVLNVWDEKEPETVREALDGLVCEIIGERSKKLERRYGFDYDLEHSKASCKKAAGSSTN